MREAEKRVIGARWQRLAQIGVGILICLLIAAPQAQAAQYKYDIQVKNPAYKYGSSGYVYVNPSPSVAGAKVTGLVTFRTDWSAIAEIGHWWGSAGICDQFYTYTDYFGLATVQGLGKPAAGSYPRYHTGYDYRDGKQNYWINNVWIAEHTVYPSMTSQWPGVNVERTTDSVYNGDNVGCFHILKYKIWDWGVWENWTGHIVEYDGDVRYRPSYISNNHVDFVYGWY
ncbi:MAG: hypothetical protein RBS17_11815 [Coriobacteriia bacterium]|nr:hypothetical protein [Coriobacteriia bacterium]